jgi:hypothetical protein
MKTSIDLVASYDFKNEQTYSLRVNNSYKRKPSYRFGSNFNFRITENGIVKTGLRYVKQVQNIFQNRLQNGFLYFEYINEYYIEIPIIYRYEISNKKISMYTEFGLSPHLFLKGELEKGVASDLSIEDYEIPYLKDRRIRLSYIFGIGVNFSPSPKIQLFFQPTYRYYPLIGTQSAPAIGTMNIGVEFGIRHVLSSVNHPIIK